MMTITGKLVRVASMGSETTGWAVYFDSSIQVEGKELSSIEVDLGDKKTDELVDKQVKIIGVLGKRQQGVTRKEYSVIIVDQIQELTN